MLTVASITFPIPPIGPRADWKLPITRLTAPSRTSLICSLQLDPQLQNRELIMFMILNLRIYRTATRRYYRQACGSALSVGRWSLHYQNKNLSECGFCCRRVPGLGMSFYLGSTIRRGASSMSVPSVSMKSKSNMSVCSDRRRRRLSMIGAPKRSHTGAESRWPISGDKHLLWLPRQSNSGGLPKSDVSRHDKRLT